MGPARRLHPPQGPIMRGLSFGPVRSPNRAEKATEQSVGSNAAQQVPSAKGPANGRAGRRLHTPAARPALSSGGPSGLSLPATRLPRNERRDFIKEIFFGNKDFRTPHKLKWVETIWRRCFRSLPTHVVFEASFEAFWPWMLLGRYLRPAHLHTSRSMWQAMGDRTDTLHPYRSRKFMSATGVRLNAALMSTDQPDRSHGRRLPLMRRSSPQPEHAIVALLMYTAGYKGWL